MAMSSDEELRLKCLELALHGKERGVLARARSYYSFTKGDKKPEDPQAKIPPPYTQEGEANRVMSMIKPT
jgi:hypothetical protein